jgi:hypothetical protein
MHPKPNSERPKETRRQRCEDRQALHTRILNEQQAGDSCETAIIAPANEDLQSLKGKIPRHSVVVDDFGGDCSAFE